MTVAARDLRARYGPWALVTGAARGIGAAFAEQLAAAGLHLVLVDRDAAGLAERAAELTTRHGVEVRAVELDLTREDVVAELAPRIADLDLGLVVLNAGLSRIASFAAQEPAFLLEQLHVNVRSTLLLAHDFARRLTARGGGGILIVSSAAAGFGSARNAAYSASKAYGLVLAESLWAELAADGVDVLAIAPGPVDTPALRAETPHAPAWMTASPDDTAREALAALGRRPTLRTGGLNRLSQAVLRHLLPAKARIRLASRMLERIAR